MEGTDSIIELQRLSDRFVEAEFEKAQDVFHPRQWFPLPQEGGAR